MSILYAAVILGLELGRTEKHERMSQCKFDPQNISENEWTPKGIFVLYDKDFALDLIEG